MDAPTIDLTKVTRAHLNIREARRELKRKFEEDDAALEASQKKLESLMLDHLNKSNMESVRTEVGTFYRQVDIKPSAADWEAVYSWIKEHDAWDLLERRLKKGFVSEYMEAHDGAMPPGVSVHREYVVRVRKAN